jgi:FkbM family methyltransferase
MLAQFREAVRATLPPKVVYAYRLVRHTTFWPCEQEMVAARQFLSPDKIAVDVGANVGLFTAVLARRSKKVIAFEPNPSCAENLRKVARRNCEVIAKAVSDSAGKTVLRVPVAQGIPLHALATIETANRHGSEFRATGFVTHEVDKVMLDQALLRQTAAEGLAFINIDAEGHEFAVLRGGEGLIVKHRPVLLVELEYRHGAQVPEIFDWLKARGFAARALTDGHNLAPIDPVQLQTLQDETRLTHRLAGSRHSGYVNNIFFIPGRAYAAAE